jgi:RNA polymerase sigma factor (sigma-70 family)
MRVIERDAAAVANDAEIIKRSWREPEQFAALFDRYAPLIHRYAARRIGREAADDLVAEAFLAAFGKRRQYHLSYTDARPWLYGIATNLVGQHRREELRQYRIRRAAIPDPNLPGHDDRVAADVTAHGVRGQLTAALAGLPDGDRDVLILIAWEQLTYDETARALDIPVGTVRSRLHRARATLREVLAVAGPQCGAAEIPGDAVHGRRDPGHSEESAWGLVPSDVSLRRGGWLSPVHADRPAKAARLPVQDPDCSAWR